MLIIDQHAEQKMAATLAPLKLDPGSSRYLYFSAREITSPKDALREAVVAAVRANLSENDANIYCFEDGDICVLARYISHKEGRDVMTDVANTLHQPIDDRWVSFLDIGHGLNRLLVTLDQKLERIHAKESAQRQQQEKETLERKRNAILSATPEVTAADIKHRREQRTQPRLMMIEDDIFSSKLVERSLEKHYPITTLQTATNALETYASFAPDLLFLDINLPNVSGHELLERLLALDPEAYIIMLSGNADRENILKAMSKGAKGFVAKPFTREKLFQYIERCPTIHHSPAEALHAHD